MIKVDCAVSKLENPKLVLYDGIFIPNRPGVWKWIGFIRNGVFKGDLLAPVHLRLSYMHQDVNPGSGITRLYWLTPNKSGYWKYTYMCPRKNVENMLVWKYILIATMTLRRHDMQTLTALLPPLWGESTSYHCYPEQIVEQTDKMQVNVDVSTLIVMAQLSVALGPQFLNGQVVTLTKLSPLAALKTYVATRDDTLVNMTTLPFQCVQPSIVEKCRSTHHENQMRTDYITATNQSQTQQL